MATYTGADKRFKHLFENGGGGGTEYEAGTGIDITNGVISVSSATLQRITALEALPFLYLDNGYIAVDYNGLEVV